MREGTCRSCYGDYLSQACPWPAPKESGVDWPTLVAPLGASIDASLIAGLCAEGSAGYGGSDSQLRQQTPAEGVDYCASADITCRGVSHAPADPGPTRSAAVRCRKTGATYMLLDFACPERCPHGSLSSVYCFPYTGTSGSPTRWITFGVLGYLRDIHGTTNPKRYLWDISWLSQMSIFG